MPETADPEPTTVFRLLSDETRLRIVRTLAAADGPLRFSRLRDRVGTRDSGRFNYHLDELRGSLVAKRENGYVLTAAGRRATRRLPVEG